MLFSLIPALLSVIALDIMFFYKLDEKNMKEIEAELVVRRKPAE